MRLLAATFGLFALAALAGGMVTGEGAVLGSGLCLVGTTSLLGWLSTWLPGPAPQESTVQVRARALLTVAGAVACVVGAAAFASSLSSI